MARPERFELPTTKFVAWYSIQLSYGRIETRKRAANYPLSQRTRQRLNGGERVPAGAVACFRLLSPNHASRASYNGFAIAVHSPPSPTIAVRSMGQSMGRWVRRTVRDSGVRSTGFQRVA